MNPLYDALNGAEMAPAGAPASPMNNVPPTDFMGAMRQLQANTGAMLKQAGYDVPGNLTGNPQATVMHLLKSGQIGGAAMQRIRPLLGMLGVR